MLSIYSLIFSLAFAKGKTCSDLQLIGFININNGQLEFITHVKSDKEKHWPIKTKSYDQRLELIAKSGELSQVKASSSQNEIVINGYLTDPQFIEKSRTAEAVKINKSECF